MSWSVIIPSIRTTLALTVLLRVIWIFNFPDIIYGMTGGGPANQTHIVTTWMISLTQQGDYGRASALGLIVLVVLPIITLYWVMHNRGIHARKGPRRQVQVVESAYAQDWAGRPVHARFDQLRQARLITIHSTADEKYFLTPTDSLQPILEAA